MHKMTCRITFWLLPLAMAVVPLPLSAAEVRLASGGVTDYTIVGPAEPSRDEAAATNDLQEFLTRITGAQFTVGGNARHRIHIGRKAPGDTAPLEAFERRVREEGGDVYIYGNGCSGNAFAVYDFLEKFFNCRWYTFFGDMSIPEKREAVFPSLTLDVVPSFDSFCYFGNLYTQRTTHGEDFRRRSRIYDYRLPEGTPVPRLGSNYPHVPSRYLPPGMVKPGADSPVYGPYKYFEDKAYFKTNPEFYSLSRSGVRDWAYHLCYSNKEMRRELIKNYLEIVEKEYKGGPALMLADLNDKGKAGMPLCWCPECAKLNETYGNTAGCYWDFILEICQVFKEKYPEILLQAPVYQSTRDVPEKMQGKFPDNLVLEFAPLDETDFLKPYEPYAPAACDMIESWRSLTDGKLAIWIYPTVYPRPLYTRPLVANIDRLVRNLRYLHRHGFSELGAEFGCGPYGEMGFNELRVYLLACLARDVEADVPALIQDFMEHYYGAAAPAMMQYLAELEQCEKNEANFMRWWPDHRSVLQYLTPENLLKWQGDFDRMEQLTAGDEKANMHVRRARTNLDEATLSVWYKFQDGQMPDRELMRTRHRKTKQDSYNDMLATYEPAEERKTYVDRCVSWADRSMYYHYAMAGEWKPLPEEFAQLPAGQLKRIVPCINNRRIPEDAEAATGLAVKGVLPEKFNLQIYRWEAPPVEVRNAFKERLMPAEVQKAAGRGYQMYYIGTSRLWPDSMLSFNIGGGMVTLGYLWDAGSPEQKYDFHLSLKLEDDGRTLWCDELVMVKSDKPSTLEDRNLYPGTAPRVYIKGKSSAENKSQKASEKLSPITQNKETAMTKEIPPIRPDYNRANYDKDNVAPFTLEDPLAFADGTKLTSPAQWPERRAEILRIFASEMYGQEPPKPEKLVVEKVEECPNALGGFAVRSQYQMWFKPDKSGPCVRWVLFRPRYAGKPVPVILFLNYRGNHELVPDPEIPLIQAWVQDEGEITDGNAASERTRGIMCDPRHRYAFPIGVLLARGFAVMSASYAELSPDPSYTETNPRFQQQNFAYTGVFSLWGKRDETKTDNPTALGAWAWGLSRGLDLAWQIPELDAAKAVVTGCSRLGKAALLAAARDERFAVCVPNQCGGGGVCLAKRDFGECIGTELIMFTHWYCKAYKKYEKNPPLLLNFDQHMLLASIAPRRVLVQGFGPNDWMDTEGEYLACRAASPVWEFLGLPGMPGEGFPDYFDTSAIGPYLGYVRRLEAHGIAAHDWVWLMDFAMQAFSDDKAQAK